MELYHRWNEIAAARAGEFALAELSTGRRWTFAGIQAEVDRRPRTIQPVLFPRGMDPDLVFETLRGWRDDAIVCPVEDVAPPLELFADVPGDIAHAKTAPGSWARERVVLFDAAQIAADCDRIVAGMALDPDRPKLGVLSMAHSYGFSSLVLPLLLHGIPLHWCGDSLPGAVNRALDRIGPATVPAVPALWRAWFDSGILKGRELLAISAGAPLDLSLERDVFEATGLKIHNFYGASECGGIAFDASETPRPDPFYVGTLLDGVRLEVSAEGFRVRSPAVGRQYWPPRIDAASLQDGCCHLGDRGEVDSGGGGVRLLKRRRDLINIAGRKIYPPAVERAIENIDGVLRCVVFGVESRNRERVDEVAACIQLRDGITIAEVKKALRGKLMRYEIPHYWWEPPDLLPEFDIGVSREELRAHLGARQSAFIDR